MSSKTKVLCLPYHNIGGHFIDWSLHFLCGHHVIDGRHHCNQHQNWHGHSCVTAMGSDQLVQKLQELDSSRRQFETIYFCSRSVIDISQHKFNLDFQQATPDQIKKIESIVADDYCQGIRHCQQHDLIPVFFDYLPNEFCTIYYNDRYPLWNGEHTTKHDAVNAYHAAFYDQSRQKFADSVWDQRELAALCYRPLGPLKPTTSDLLDLSLPHLYYTNNDVWNGLDRCLEEMCEVWNLPLDQDRFSAWRDIYSEWRCVHDAAFAQHLPRIIDAVVHGRYLSLRRFKINFWMEVIIQHELITKHNLNLRTWQLEKFPDNTQDLHQLLEPNFHQL